eukprot:5456248-Prymnesium_polylepis.3
MAVHATVHGSKAPEPFAHAAAAIAAASSHGLRCVLEGSGGLTPSRLGDSVLFARGRGRTARRRRNSLSTACACPYARSSSSGSPSSGARRPRNVSGALEPSTAAHARAPPRCCCAQKTLNTRSESAGSTATTALATCVCPRATYTPRVTRVRPATCTPLATSIPRDAFHDDPAASHLNQT